MSFNTVKNYLSKNGFRERIYEFDTSSATVAEAASALGCEGKEIAKTMSFMLDGKAVLIIAAGDTKIDNVKFKAQFHTKAVMLKSDEVEELTGHPVGGVCPFCVKEGTKIYADLSIKRFENVYPACGSRNSAVKMTPDEIFKYSESLGWVDVCKTAEQI